MLRKKIGELTIIPIKRHLEGGSYSADELITGEIIDDMGDGRGYDADESEWAYIPGKGWTHETLDNIDWLELIDEEE